MTGTFINIATVLIGGVLGMLFGSRLPERVRQTVIAGLGLFTAAIGIQMFMKTQNAIIVLASLLIGGLLGEWWRIEDGLRRLGAFLEKRFTGSSASARTNSSASTGTSSNASADSSEMSDLQLAHGEDQNSSSSSQPVSSQLPLENRFIRGFLTASLVFCVGPMAILGSIQDGLSGDYKLLAIKAVLDGFASLAFASSLGVGVLFSSLVILAYQGGLSLLALQAQALISPAMMNEMTAAGGVLLLGIAVSSLLEIKPIRVGNFLPALAIAPLMVALLAAFGR